MSLTTRRKAADAGRRAADRVGARNTIVTIVERQYSAAIGTVGASLTTTTLTVVDPRPKVVAGAQQVSAFGGGFGSDAVGGLTSDEYDIGPITLPYNGGGYAPATLLKLGDVTKRVTIRLEGDGFPTGGDEFEVVPDSVVATRQHQLTFRVKRTRQL